MGRGKGKIHGSDVSRRARGTVSYPISSGRVTVTPEALEHFGPDLLRRLCGASTEMPVRPAENDGGGPAPRS